jgi:hypothetical protein
MLHPNREVATNVDVCGSVTAKPEQAGSLVGAGYGRVQGVTVWGGIVNPKIVRQSWEMVTIMTIK